MKRQKCVVIAEEDRPRVFCQRYFKQSNLGKTGSESQIKQTSSLELTNHRHIGDDYPYWMLNRSVRRLNSNSIPKACLTNDHPQSLEIISKKGDVDNNKIISSHPQSLEVNFLYKS